MVGPVVVCSAVTAVLVVLGVSLDLVGHMISQVDMLLGMGLGMSTGPIMMVAIKRWRTRRKVDKMLKDIVRMNKEQINTEGKPEEEKEPLNF